MSLSLYISLVNKWFWCGCFQRVQRNTSSMKASTLLLILLFLLSLVLLLFISGLKISLRDKNKNSNIWWLKKTRDESKNNVVSGCAVCKGLTLLSRDNPSRIWPTRPPFSTFFPNPQFLTAWTWLYHPNEIRDKHNNNLMRGCYFFMFRRH